MRLTLKACLLWTLVSSAVLDSPAAARQGDGEAPSRVGTTPLKVVDSVAAFGDAWVGWVNPVLCDDGGDAYYFLTLAPLARTAGSGNTASATPRMRDVLRISADGQKRSTISPTTSPKLANATSLKTSTMALHPDGALSLLVWARWVDENGTEEEAGQYIVTFDKDGRHRSDVEVDSPELNVSRLEVFGSGQFLLRGRRTTNLDEERLMVFSASGQFQRDVDWAADSSVPQDPAETTDLDEPPRPRWLTQVEHMLRGGDGRIYVTRPGEEPGEHVVHAISPSGVSEKALVLPRLAGEPRLSDLKASRNRLAAAYVESVGQTLRSWIAVYDLNYKVEGEPVTPLALYGPAPGVPIAYRQEGSSDRFTFVKEGKLVTLSSS